MVTCSGRANWILFRLTSGLAGCHWALPIFAAFGVPAGFCILRRKQVAFSIGSQKRLNQHLSFRTEENDSLSAMMLGFVGLWLVRPNFGRAVDVGKSL